VVVGAGHRANTQFPDTCGQPASGAARRFLQLGQGMGLAFPIGAWGGALGANRRRRASYASRRIGGRLCC